MTINSARGASAGRSAPAVSLAPTIRIQCRLHNDVRLFIGASAIAAHVARHGGFSERAQEDLASAAVEACRQVFGPVAKGGSPAMGELTASSFPDRVEVTVDGPGKGSAGRSKGRSRTPVAKKGKGFTRGLVDDVRHETRDGHSSITLVKYSGGARRHSRT